MPDRLGCQLEPSRMSELYARWIIQLEHWAEYQCDLFCCGLRSVGDLTDVEPFVAFCVLQSLNYHATYKVRWRLLPFLIVVSLQRSARASQSRECREFFLSC